MPCRSNILSNPLKLNKRNQSKLSLFCRDELVVHPSWILDSIKAVRLLPVNDYLLYQPRQAAQKVLNFTSKLSTLSSAEGRGHTTVTSTLQSPEGRSMAEKSSSCTSVPQYTRTPEEVELQHQDICDDKDNRTGITGNDSINRKTDMSAETYEVKISSENNSKEEARFKRNDDGDKGDVSLQDTVETTTSKINTEDSILFKRPIGLPRAGDANFVSEFYNNSRLHYLSTWGAEFKKYTSDLIKSGAAKGWKCRGSGQVGPHGRVIMHIDMDSFFVSVTLRDQPHLRGKPIAVCHAGKSSSSAEQGGQGH